MGGSPGRRPGPVALRGSLEPTGLSETRIVTSLRRDGLVVALVAVTPDFERVKIATTPEHGSVERPEAQCMLQDGLALCMLRAEGSVDVYPMSGQTGIVIPVP